MAGAVTRNATWWIEDVESMTIRFRSRPPGGSSGSFASTRLGGDRSVRGVGVPPEASTWCRLPRIGAPGDPVEHVHLLVGQHRWLVAAPPVETLPVHHVRAGLRGPFDRQVVGVNGHDHSGNGDGRPGCLGKDLGGSCGFVPGRGQVAGGSAVDHEGVPGDPNVGNYPLTVQVIRATLEACLR